MTYTYFLWVGLFFSTVSGASWFAKDRAVLKAQKGDWPGARMQLTRALVDAPDDAATLYDAGVASYKTGDINQAAAYFKRATEASACPPSIKEQSYFNWGNTCVQQKELQKALEHYDMVLKLNEKNERARHNRDVVKKMLEQQKQQEQKNQENKQDNDTKKEASDSPQKQQQEDKQDAQQQQKDKKDKGQNSSNASQDQQEKDERRDTQQDQQDAENKAGDARQKHSEQEKKESDEQRAREQKKQEEHAGKQDEQAQEHQEQKDQSQAAAQQERDKQAREQQQKDTREHASQEASATHKEKEQKVTGWMAQLLKEQEQRDARVNKQLMQVAVSKKMGGEDGQNCW